MELSKKNIAIFEEIFNWQPIPELSQEFIPQLAESIGINVSSREIMLKTSWLNYRDYQVMAIEGHQLFHIKRLWEPGSIKEILGLEIGRLIDPDMCISNYVFGYFTTRFLHTPVPFVLTTWVEGAPIEKKRALEHAFELGKQYEFGRWLCLYDCQPRHYFLQTDGSFRRIDYGLAFFKFQKAYEGFADIWPKELFKSPEFLAGIKHEHEKIQMRFEILESHLMEILSRFEQIELDDFVNVRGRVFKQELMDYWEREDFVDSCGHIKKRFSFLHSPVANSDGSNVCE
jgi:hypothetical protein